MRLTEAFCKYFDVLYGRILVKNGISIDYTLM